MSTWRVSTWAECAEAGGPLCPPAQPKPQLGAPQLIFKAISPDGVSCLGLHVQWMPHQINPTSVEKSILTSFHPQEPGQSLAPPV
jgi:hypothetical protein